MVIYMIKTKPKRLRKIPDRLAQNSFGSDKMLPKVISVNSIDIIMEYKINKKHEITFKLIAGKINIRVKRTIKDFLQIEDYLTKYLDSKMPELRSLIPSIEKAKTSQSTTDHSMIYENRLKSINKFLQAISETPELWTRDMLIFIGIDKGIDQAVYLQKRHEVIQRKHKGIQEEAKEMNPNPFGLPLYDEVSSNR